LAGHPAGRDHDPVQGDPAGTGAKTLSARAWALGERIDVRPLERGETLALAPLTLRAGERGVAVLFRYGAVVFVDVAPLEQAAFLEKLRPFVSGAFEAEGESVEIAIDAERGDRVEASGTLVLRRPGVERLQVVADVLAKSAVLAHYEERVASVFDRIESLAHSLERGGRNIHGRDLLREIGSALLIQTRTVGRLEISDKPEITWDDPELDRFYEHLAAQYELRERDLALSRKLDVVSRTAETYLDLIHNRRSIRVEWYIVILILVEIALLVYDLFLVH
jgi:uncharacterized Rmd1/YagE family protein